MLGCLPYRFCQQWSQSVITIQYSIEAVPLNHNIVYIYREIIIYKIPKACFYLHDVMRLQCLLSAIIWNTSSSWFLHAPFNLNFIQYEILLTTCSSFEQQIFYHFKYYLLLFDRTVYIIPSNHRKELCRIGRDIEA